MDISTLTIEKALELLARGEITSVSLVEACIEEIKKKDGEVHAYLEVFTDALEQAKIADQKRKDGDTGSLLGIPFSIKDNILIEGKRAGAASKILENYVAPYDATVIKNLKKAGAVFIGRVNMDEFAMGGSTENSAYGITKNPLDTSRVSGGSSGGSAASVSMHGALASLGSDTGGSIRQPASYCGVVGLKPTYGSVSRHGLMAMGSSLDVIGPIAHTVRDCEIVFNAIKGFEGGRDVYDSTSLSADEYKKVASEHVREESRPLRVGIVPALMNMGGVQDSVKKNLEESIELLKKAGCEIVDVELPNIGYSLAVYYVLMPAEVSSNMSRFDGVKFGSKSEGGDLLEDYLKTRGELLGKEVRRRIMLGTYVLSSGYYDAYYNKANVVRKLIADDFKKAFTKVDVILTPTAPSPAFKIGAHSSDPLQMYLEDVFTVTANLVGVPAISVPSGVVEDEGVKLPLGIQFTAPHCREDILFEVGKKFESVRVK
ncbi:MAG: Asp-tRNA(Asn)/Glu-tRNA(Gln) amidotransferase subunit GatA [Candidatus Taylorbacteria bacterium]|nr:Asp-tRNA(Asn)/Glu-tRNA(Gln) amidotransferase subunit GatA [Candidatus Taylorbacteria bacterium]